MKTTAKSQREKVSTGASLFSSNSSSTVAELQNHKEDKLLALSAGSLRSVVTEQVLQLVVAKKRNFLAIAKEGLSRLLSDKLISKSDFQNLSLIITLVAQTQKNKDNNDEKIKRVFTTMSLNNSTSHVALAIAGLATSPVRYSLPGDDVTPKAVAKMSRSNAADTGMVAGALAGAVIGGVIGGFGGAVAGAVIGGIVGGVAGLCAD